MLDGRDNPSGYRGQMEYVLGGEALDSEVFEAKAHRCCARAEQINLIGSR